MKTNETHKVQRCNRGLKTLYAIAPLANLFLDNSVHGYFEPPNPHDVVLSGSVRLFVVAGLDFSVARGMKLCRCRYFLQWKVVATCVTS